MGPSCFAYEMVAFADVQTGYFKANQLNNSKHVKEYNFDVIISVGYRINYILGTKFRKWATQTLKQPITQGYTIDKSKVETDPNRLIEVISQLKNTAQT